MNLFDAHKEQLKLKQPVRLFEAFSGIGTQAMALKRLGVEIEHVGISEIDKHAIASYYAIHGDVKNYGNIMEIKGSDLPQIDIFTWSFPCTDLSKAGKQKGLNGTRSGLGYQVLRIVSEMEHKPKVLLMENVPDLLSEKFKDGWREMYHEIESMGYTNYVEILNAKNYGVAQNRERVFMVSILDDYAYEFSKGFKLEKRLKDYLEDEVDEKYYLSDETISRISNWKAQQKPLESILNDNAISPTLTARGAGEEHSGMVLYGEPMIAIPEATIQGYALAEDGDGVYINRPHQKRGVVQDGMIQTIKTSGDDVGVVVQGNEKYISERFNEFEKENGYRPEFFNPYNKSEIKDIAPTITTMSDRWQSSATVAINQNLRIRKLTPLECWRLMGISDDDFYKAQAVVSKSQLYKQAGNAIVVDVLMAIFGKML